MEASTYQEIQELFRMTVGQLREKYLDVFGEETRARHKTFRKSASLGACRLEPRAISRSERGGGPRSWPTIPI